jgi:hypothetical protein
VVRRSDSLTSPIPEIRFPNVSDGGFNVSDDSQIHASATRAAGQLRPHLEGAIAERKHDGGGGGGEDVIGRLLAMQADPATALSDAQIATNLIGMVVGFIPTVATAVPFAIDALLERPDALAGAQRAAREDDDEAVRAHMWEAMRLAPFAAGVLRRTRTDALLAANTPPRDADPRRYVDARGDRVGDARWRCSHRPRRLSRRAPRSRLPALRSRLHHCFGRFVNAMQIPLIAKPLLRRERLARVPGTDGQLLREGPYAKSLVVELDR